MSKFKELFDEVMKVNESKLNEAKTVKDILSDIFIEMSIYVTGSDIDSLTKEFPAGCNVQISKNNKADFVISGFTTTMDKINSDVDNKLKKAKAKVFLVHYNIL